LATTRKRQEKRRKKKEGRRDALPGQALSRTSQRYKKSEAEEKEEADPEPAEEERVRDDRRGAESEELRDFFIAHLPSFGFAPFSKASGQAG